MALHSEISGAIDRYKETAVGVSRQIHDKPELKFEERFAAELLTRALGDLGLRVETGVGGLPTAFRAVIGSGAPTIAIMAEYDALPNGHSCGHNLIAGAALAAFTGLAQVRDRIAGRVMILGTPAEEGGGGKIKLLNEGALEGVDAALMAHPADFEFSAVPSVLACRHLRLTFHGKAAHAAGAPWDGTSALSAVIQTFQSVDAARVHFRDRSRIHGIITDGGQAVNIIPARASCDFLVRAPSSRYADEIGERVERCAQAAALATGARLEVEVLPGTYKNMINNLAMVERYAHHTRAFGVSAPIAPPDFPMGSTDMGDVSHAMPAIHPMFQVSDHGTGTCHEDAFVNHANAPRAYDAMIRAAKAMALTAYDLIAEPELLAAAKAGFAERKES